ncbi:MAG: hypothetical protein ACF8R7_03090 [Phycisphaerales bacterium JB039]
MGLCASTSRITPQVDQSLFPGARKAGEDGDASPILVLDQMGYHAIIIELRNQEPEGAAAEVSPTTHLSLLERVF